MKLTPVFAVAAALAAATTCSAQQGIVEQAERLELQGQFKQAAGVLKSALSDKSRPQTEHKKLGFELDRLERIRKDFSLTKDELSAELKKVVKNLRTDEFARWIAEGRFDA